jgi:hypothetical protein
VKVDGHAEDVLQAIGEMRNGPSSRRIPTLPPPSLKKKVAKVAAKVKKTVKKAAAKVKKTAAKVAKKAAPKAAKKKTQKK